MARRKVIEWLIHRLENEVDDAHFVMNAWLQKIKDGENVIYRSEKDIPHCKTAGCMAGTLFLGLPTSVREAYLKLPDTWGNRGANVMLAGKEQLGLTYKEAYLLFSPSLNIMKNITRQTAITMLKRMLTHSEINWLAVAPNLDWSEYSSPEALPITLTDD